MSKITYYIHPAVRGQHRICRLRHFHGKQELKYLTHEAWLDLPGAYEEDLYNLHYDGCNYCHESFMECIERLLEYDAYTLEPTKGVYRRAEVELVFTNEAFIESHENWRRPYKDYINFNFVSE